MGSLTRCLLFAGVIGLAGCMPRNEPVAKAPDMHTSRNALDWAGTYEGVLPCADCPGIKTRLVLMADGQFELSTQYIDRQPTPQVTRGRFAWNAAGNDITVGDAVGAQQFRVGEGRLLQLNRDGSAPAWDAPGRVLTRATAGGAAPAPAPGAAAADPALSRSLQDKVWTLKSGTDAGGQPIAGLMPPGQPFVLRFDASRLSVSGGCNSMGGGWRLDGAGKLVVGRMASTMKACEPALMQADRTLAALLEQPLAAQLEPGATPTLRLTTATKQTLLLAGQPTLESLYGAPTRVFLEVAAQTVPCPPGAAGPAQCLQVRERRFDDKGLRIDPPGEWRAFTGRIEGYTHTPGVRNVVRLNRYQKPAAGATDAAAFVYVLDLVVESETVAR